MANLANGGALEHARRWLHTKASERINLYDRTKDLLKTKYNGLIYEKGVEI